MTTVDSFAGYAGRPRPQIGLAGVRRAAATASLVLGLGLVGAAMVPIDGAVIATGQLLVQGKPQAVQSLDSGIVSGLAVRNGETVSAGQVLLTLDATLPKTRLDIAMERLAVALTEEQRLSAEALGLERPDFTAPTMPFAPPDLGRAAERQLALFVIRRHQQVDAQRRLAETDAQIALQIESLDAQRMAATEEQRILQADIDRQGRLVSQGLGREAPLNELRRQAAALGGRIASLGAEMARLEGNRREAAVLFTEEENRRAEEVAQGLRDASASVQELVSEIVSLRDAVARTELRAPVEGVVHELSVSAPGSVIAAGATLAQIVPIERGLEIEVAVDPRNIDSVHEGQAAEVVLSTYDPRVVPRLPARVGHVPPGAAQNPETGQSFYRVALVLEPGSVPAGIDLRPGMPVEAYITTGERSLASWLVAPLARPLARAMRED